MSELKFYLKLILIILRSWPIQFNNYIVLEIFISYRRQRKIELVIDLAREIIDSVIIIMPIEFTIGHKSSHLYFL